MNETPSPFEQELSSLRLRTPQTDDAELLYRCGYEAALAARTAHRRSPSAQTFICGTLTGIAASLLSLLGWSALLDGGTGETTRVIVESETSGVAARAAPRVHPPLGAAAGTDADTEAETETQQANAVADFLVALRTPWNWSAREKITQASHRPLSPAANNQLALLGSYVGSSAGVAQQVAPEGQLQDLGGATANSPADGELGSTLTLDQLGKRSTSPQPQEDPVKVVRPAAEPEPALRYRFWPRERELQVGSAQLHFYRALAHNLQLPMDERQRIHQKWFSEAPQPDAAERTRFVEGMHNIYNELHEMALSEDMAWDHRSRDMQGPSIYMYLLHDVQESRALARLLTLKIDHHLDQGEFELAISCIQDGYRLASFVAEGETLIQQLVAVAISSMMRSKAEDAIQHPDCPNLYWAVATIPKPITNMRRALQIELGNLPRIFPVLREVELDGRDEDYWMDRWAESIKDLQMLAGDNSDLNVAIALAPVMFSGPAKQRLLAGGFDSERVKDMPNMQAILLDAAIELRRVRDDLEKSSLIPYERARELMEREDDHFRQWIEDRKRTSAAVALAEVVLPAANQARSAEVRDLYMHHRLMNIEAIRMHAAAHDGQVPDSLEALQPVPALHNPFDGQPFHYSIDRDEDGVTVTLDGDVPESMKDFSKFILRIQQ